MGITKKINYLYASALLAVGGLLVSVQQVFAAPSSTPEEVLDTVVGETVDASVDLMTYVIQNYLKYILVVGIAITLYFTFKRFAHIGSR
jgi:hypothetical protein